jgi:hypothetical protein
MKCKYKFEILYCYGCGIDDPCVKIGNKMWGHIYNEYIDSESDIDDCHDTDKKWRRKIIS